MRKPSALWVAVAVLLVGLGSGVYGVGQVDKQGEAQLQAAKNTELVKGDLKAAIDQYKKILARRDVGRTVAAKALLEMGQCYEKLGQAEARTTYEQLLRQYGDQAEQVQAARARLAALAGTPGGTAAAEMVIRRVWSGAGVDVSGSLSPDGKYLSIMDAESGDLATWEIASGQKRRLTNKGSWSTTEMVLGSTWSPDGKKIAFAWLNKNNALELRIIGSDGSDPRLLPTAAWPLDWSPDGKTLLALVLRNSGASTELTLVSVADGSVTTFGAAAKPISSWHAGYSADGKYIAYDNPQQEGSQERDIFIASIDGKQGIPLVKHAADDQLLGWLPGSDTVLFASSRTGTQDAWALHVAEGKPQGEPVLVRKDIGQISPMGFSDKRAFYYNVGVSVVDVFEASLDLAKGTVVDPPRKVAQRVAGTSYSAEWSPDGKYLAYVSERKAGSASQSSYILCIRSEQTGEEREIPLSVDSLWKMHWAADSGAVFATMGGKAAQGLFRIDIQTGKQTLLARSGWSDSLIKDFAVAPDGRSVYYAHFQWVKKLVTIIRHSLETGQEAEVYRKAAGPDLGALTFSPDGKHVSFSTADELSTSGFVIRILPTAGGETREVLRGGLETFTPHAWTPDGKTILFIKRTATGTKDEKRELWQVASAGGEPRKINLGMELRDLRLHPDGRRLVFTSGKNSKEVWVMENFLPSAKGGK